MMFGLRYDNIDIYVKDLETNSTTTYYAIIECSRCLNIGRKNVYAYLYRYRKLPYLGRYVFSYNLGKVNAVNRFKKEVYVYNCLTGETKKYVSINEVSLNTGITASAISATLRKRPDRMLFGYYVSYTPFVKEPVFDKVHAIKSRNTLYIKSGGNIDD